MKLLAVLLSMVLFSAPASALMCVEVFAKPTSLLTTMIYLPRHEPVFQPAEIKEHGLIIDPQTKKGLDAALSVMSTRDGAYPLIVEKSGVVVMDHQLPNPQADGSTAFLGNHRGLYEKLKNHLGSTPKILFAGEVRVIGGVPAFLTDFSIHFYKNLDPNLKSRRQASRVLVEHNQARLERIFLYLSFIKLVSEPTKIINYEDYHFDFEKDHRREGFVKSLSAARFEIQCRANPSCWDLHERAQFYVRELMARGGEKYLRDNIRTFSEMQPSRASHFIQQASLVVRHGLLEVMSFSGVATPGTERNRLFVQFVEEAPLFLGDH